VSQLQANIAEPPAGLASVVTLPPDQLELLARRVSEVLMLDRGDGFVDVDGAADYLGLSRKAIYRLVERHRLPHHRAGGRLLFDHRELRAWVELGG